MPSFQDVLFSGFALYDVAHLAGHNFLRQGVARKDNATVEKLMPCCPDVLFQDALNVGPPAGHHCSKSTFMCEEIPNFQFPLLRNVFI